MNISPLINQLVGKALFASIIVLLLLTYARANSGEFVIVRNCDTNIVIDEDAESIKFHGNTTMRLSNINIITSSLEYDSSINVIKANNVAIEYGDNVLCTTNYLEYNISSGRFIANGPLNIVIGNRVIVNAHRLHGRIMNGTVMHIAVGDNIWINDKLKEMKLTCKRIAYDGIKNKYRMLHVLGYFKKRSTPFIYARVIEMQRNNTGYTGNAYSIRAFDGKGGILLTNARVTEQHDMYFWFIQSLHYYLSNSVISAYHISNKGSISSAHPTKVRISGGDLEEYSSAYITSDLFSIDMNVFIDKSSW